MAGIFTIRLDHLTLTHSSLGASMASYDSIRAVARDRSWCWLSRWRRAPSTVDTNRSTCSIYDTTPVKQAYHGHAHCCRRQGGYVGWSVGKI